MRFGLIHRIMTDALASLGVIALVLSGQFSRWTSGALLAGLALAVFTPEAWLRRPWLKHVDTAIVLVVLALQVTRVVLGASVLDVLIEFAAMLQIVRLATRRGAAHDQQIILLALLHLVAGTVLGGGIGYGLCFFGVLIVAPGALALSHLRREVEGNYRQGARDRTGLPVDVPRILRSKRVVGRGFLLSTCLLSLPIFVFTAVLFIAFPRVGLSFLLLNRPHTGRMVGFSDRVNLGEVGLLRTDPTIALRLEVLAEKDLANPPERRTFHLRGTALDAYDGRAWTQSVKGSQPLNPTGSGLYVLGARQAPHAAEPTYRVELESFEPPVVFLPEGTIGIKPRARGLGVVTSSPTLIRGAEDELKYHPPDERGLTYDVYLSVGQASERYLHRAGVERYLQLPETLPERIRTLSMTWTSEARTPLEKAQAIQRHLRAEYRYDLGSPSGKSAQPLDDFLFESKRGHCEFYSTAMAVMLRVVGVPTRNVTGFVGGTYNRFGKFYAVRQGDAHSWVEAWIDGQGWRTFDPTPPADAQPKSELGGTMALLRDFLEASSQRWQRNVVGYDLDQQVGVFKYFALRSKLSSALSLSTWSPWQWALALGAALVAVLLARLWWRRRRKRVDGPAHAPARRSPSALDAIALYEQLERVMMSAGVARSPGTPPLGHAEALRAQAHPLGAEALELTRLYLDARFGDRVLTDEDRRAFERRVKALRRIERPKPAAS
jgi:transglutaminase-like putative cysteine protease